jgi:Protein of unknown function (DUF4231)
VSRRGKDAMGGGAGPVEQDWLENQLGKLIVDLDLQPLQRDSLRVRWLDQVRWMDGKAKVRQPLSPASSVGADWSVIIFALAGLNTGRASSSVQRTVFDRGLLVTLFSAIESLFRFGDHWRHCWQMVELLRSERWQILRAANCMSMPSTSRAIHCSPRRSRRSSSAS